MAMSTRGIHALKQVGLDEEIMAMAIPMAGRTIHLVEGDLGFQPYGQKEEEVIYSVSRVELNKALITAAEKYEGVRFHFNERCTGVALRTGVVYVRDERTDHTRSIPLQQLIGTDGSASAVRTALLSAGRFDISQQYLDHGYKELTIPPGPGGTFMLAPNTLHIWPRGLYMLIALPNPDGSFTCTLFFPHEGEYSFSSLSTPEKVLDFFSHQFSDAVPLIPNLAEAFFANPTGNLVTVKCFPWHYQNSILLMGDAAHAIVPFFGQGMNCGFEDCTLLDECIEQHGPDWERIFEEFGKLRKENVDAIADMALTNYIEMRDRVTDPAFLLQAQAGLLLEQRYPDLFIPKYSMVSFHRLPYAEALRRADIQESILQQLCASITSVEEIDWPSADRLIKERLIKD
jgi:kynurenine 3-monooxygenase